MTSRQTRSDFVRTKDDHSPGKRSILHDRSRSALCNGFAIVWMVVFATLPVSAVTVTGFNPVLGSPGEQVTVFGSGFAPGGQLPSTLVVKFNGTPDTTITTNDVSEDGALTAHVPNGATTGTVSVKINNDTGTSLLPFTVIGPGPYVTNFTPKIGSAGMQVFIYGVHFITNGVPAVTAVRFNGTNAPGPFVSAENEIQVNAPTGVTTGPITVVTPLGSFSTATNTFSLATNFFVPPVITAFSPATGRTGTNVIITGINFIGAFDLRFNGLSATFIVSNNTTMMAIVPTNAGTGQIVVFAPNGSASSGTNFRMPPTITGFSPTNGAVGTNITINGANFNEGTPSVTIGGVSATISGTPTFSQIIAIVQPGTTNGPVSVTTTNGTVTSAGLFYMPPRIISFSANSSPAGSRITISGQNFLGATAVRFNGTPATSFNVTNNTTLGATVPANFITGPISVTTPGGTTNSTDSFYGAPVILSFSPTHGLPGTNVTIIGTNFLATTAVSFNGTNAPFSVVNNGNILATVPTNATTGPITVAGLAATNTSVDSFVLDYSSDIAVTVTDSPDPAAWSSNLVYTIVITNKGPLDAPGVMLTNTLPATVLLKSATTTRGSLNTNSNPIIGDLGQLAVSASATIILTVVPQSSGTIINQTVAGSLYPDPVPSNNSVTSTTFVQPRPFLSILRIASPLVQISWPVVLSNYSLQYNINSVSSASWSNFTGTIQNVDTNNVVIEPIGGTMRFYRLKN